jgi:hypothetical protein
MDILRAHDITRLELRLYTHKSSYSRVNTPGLIAFIDLVWFGLI